VTAVVAEVGDVRGGELVDPQPEVQQQPRRGGGAQPGRAAVGVGGGEEGAGLVAVEPDGGGVVGIDRGTADRGSRVGREQVVLDEVAVEAGERREPARGARGGGPRVEQLSHPQVHVHPAGVEDVDVELAQPVQPGTEITAVGPAGPWRAVAGEPGRGQQPDAVGMPDERRVLGVEAGEHRAGEPHGGRGARRGCGSGRRGEGRRAHRGVTIRRGTDRRSSSISPAARAAGRGAGRSSATRPHRRFESVESAGVLLQVTIESIELLGCARGGRRGPPRRRRRGAARPTRPRVLDRELAQPGVPGRPRRAHADPPRAPTSSIVVRVIGG
jgi:hypothetical protein